MSVGPILVPGQFRRGSKGIGDLGGVTRFGVFIAALQIALSFSPPLIFLAGCQRKYSTTIKVRVGRLRGTRNPRYFLTRENIIKLDALVIRFWVAAIPDYNQ